MCSPVVDFMVALIICRREKILLLFLWSYSWRNPYKQVVKKSPSVHLSLNLVVALSSSCVSSQFSFDQVIGKALVLDEIINYIQSLQRQVEVIVIIMSCLMRLCEITDEFIGPCSSCR